MGDQRRVPARTILDEYRDKPTLTPGWSALGGPGRFPRRALLGGGSLAAAAAGLTVGRAMAGGSTTFTPPADLSGLPVVNITAAPFNADPTGATDSTAAILAAVGAAGSNGRVYAPAGTYLILGASNGNGPIVLTGDGAFEGAGSRWSGGPNAGTTFLCGDATAGILFNGNGMASNFVIDGNKVALTPLQRGTQTGAGSFGTFMNVAVVNSARDGWTIISSQNDSYYSCVSHGSARDNLYIDGGAGGLDFYHWNDSSCGRYGIRSDGLVLGLAGSYLTHTEAIRFWGGISEAGNFLGQLVPSGVTRIMLRDAVDWAFPCMNIFGTGMTGPAIHIDQGSCYAINLSDALIWANKSGLSPGQACVQIDGAAGFGGDIILNGTYFVAGDNSVYVATGSPTLTAFGMVDHTTFGPVGGSNVPEANSLLRGNTGPWLPATLLNGWIGTAHYRYDAASRVELRGKVIGKSGTAAFRLPAGYFPPTTPTLMVLMGTGMGSLGIGTSGLVTPTQVLGETTKGVLLDGVSFPAT
jgi:hypothetical protein